MNCSLCYSENFKRYSVDQPVFRHLDFEKIGQGIDLFKCLTCGLIYQNRDSVYLKNSEKEFEGSSYANSGQTGNIQSLEGNTESRRVDFQGDFLFEKVLKSIKNPSVLDLGAFDGTLLKILSEKINGRLYAYDINESLKGFYNNSEVSFSTSKEDCESRQYDLIITSQSLMYFSDLDFVKRIFKNSLKANGKIFIQVPDVLENPCAITLADQRSFYTRSSLKRMAGHLGFSCSFFEGLQPKKEVVCLLEASLETDTFEESDELELILTLLDGKKEEVKNIKDIVHILGTTVNASWVGAIMDNKLIAGFFDEDPGKENGTLLGKKIFSHFDMKDETLLIPYPDAFNSLYEKFSVKFKKVISLF